MNFHGANLLNASEQGKPKAENGRDGALRRPLVPPRLAIHPRRGVPA
jgi:hypothetical protein